MSAFLVFVVSTSVVVLTYFGLSTTWIQSALGAKLTIWAASAGVIGSLGYGFLWIPFRRHEEQKSECAKETGDLRSKIVSLEEKKKALSILTNEKDLIPTQKEQNELGYSYGCRFVLRNDGNLTVDDVRLEITDLFSEDDGRRDALGPVFPIRVPLRDLDSPARINPGDQLDFLFLRGAKTTEVYDMKHVNGILMGCGHAMGFNVDEEYPITFRISAVDMKQMTISRKLVFTGSYPVMQLR